MALDFPTRRFGFLDTEWGIERQTLSGGTSLSGERDTISTDGGGRIFAELSNGTLMDRNTTLAWRALLANLEEGAARANVPMCDARHTPFSVGGSRVPHSDGSTFSDDSEYLGGFPLASTVGATALRATQITLSIHAAQPLIGGEWFAIEHPVKGWRMYCVRTILSQAGGVATVTFRPPLREAVDAQSYVELREPRCLMVQDGTASAKKSGRATVAAIRFVEAP